MIGKRHAVAVARDTHTLMSLLNGIRGIHLH